MSSQQLRITLAGSEYVVEPGTTAGEVLALAGRDGGTDVIAARVNGELRDLAYLVAAGDVVEPVDVASDDGRYIVRHSAAHVMAQAVQELFPQAKLGIGPPVENGFYYDFDVPEPFTPEDLKAIEGRMRQIVKQGQRFSRRVVTDEQARAELAAEPYKLELIGLKGHGSGSLDFELSEGVEVGGDVLTIYDNLDAGTGELRWKDLCRGPHVPTTRQIPVFKLMRAAAPTGGVPHDDTIMGGCFVPGAPSVVTGGHDGKIKFWGPPHRHDDPPATAARRLGARSPTSRRIRARSLPAGFLEEASNSLTSARLSRRRTRRRGGPSAGRNRCGRGNSPWRRLGAFDPAGLAEKVAGISGTMPALRRASAQGII